MHVAKSVIRCNKACIPQYLEDVMFMLLGGNEKKNKKENALDEKTKQAKDLFMLGRFPVVTTQVIEARPIAKVLGLVCCRGFDSEEAFFGMAAMAVKKGAQGIIGYNENVAFHPDGSKYFSCFGTAVMFEREGRSDLMHDSAHIKNVLSKVPTAPIIGQAQNTVSGYSDATTQVNNTQTSHAKKMNSAHVAAQMAAEEDLETGNTAVTAFSSKPSEADDPVLQRLLASQKRQANQSIQ